MWKAAVSAALAVAVLAEASTASLSANVARAESTASDATTRPLKIMVVGDSISHGHEGSYTWRYRMWQWFTTNDIGPFDFVGPYTGTIAPIPVKPPQPPHPIEDPDPVVDVDSYPRVDWGYAKEVEQEFDADHYATSGDRADRVQGLIQERVEEFDPDILLVLLGTNDLAWGGHLPDELLKDIKLLVDNARSAKPSIKIALGNVPGRTYVNSKLAEYIVEVNELLRDACPIWSSTDSPIHYVDVAAAYSCGLEACTAAFDGLHPNELGAYQIAYAFSKTLVEDFSIGQSPIQVPDTMPKRPLPPPTNVLAESSPMGIKVTWDRPFGITEFKVRQRPQDTLDWFVYSATKNRTDTSLPSAGLHYEYQIQSCFGDRCGDWTETATATSGRDTAPPPQNIRTRPTDIGFVVDWSPPDTDRNITQYEIRFTNWQKGLILAVGSRKLSATLWGQESGEFSIIGNVISVEVATWTGEGHGGVYANARPVVPGAGRPMPPSHLSSHMLNTTAVSLKWSASKDAAGYLVHARYSRPSRSQLESEPVVVLGTQYVLIVPEGDKKYQEVCVSAINGQLESKETCTSRKGLSPFSLDYMRTYSYLSAAYFLLLVVLSYFISRKFIWTHYQGLRIRV